MKTLLLASLLLSTSFLTFSASAVQCRRWKTVQTASITRGFAHSMKKLKKVCNSYENKGYRTRVRYVGASAYGEKTHASYVCQIGRLCRGR